jgi:gluconokinase
MTCAGLHVVVMGVSGSGKSTVATELARRLGFVMIEGDDLHPPSNVEKMAAGVPLTDDDRRPWLETLRDLLGDHHEKGEGTVLACSALRRAYRDLLRSALPPDEAFVIALDVDHDTLRRRMAQRTGHYMPVSLLESQLATLEPLEPDERGVTLDAGKPLEDVVAAALAAVEAVRQGRHGTLPPGR